LKSERRRDDTFWRTLGGQGPCGMAIFETAVIFALIVLLMCWPEIFIHKQSDREFAGVYGSYRVCCNRRNSGRYKILPVRESSCFVYLLGACLPSAPACVLEGSIRLAGCDAPYSANRLVEELCRNARCRSPLAEPDGIPEIGEALCVRAVCVRPRVSQTEPALQFMVGWGVQSCLDAGGGRLADSRNHARSMTNVVPLPGSLRTAILPPWSLITDCTMARPKPVPWVLVV